MTKQEFNTKYSKYIEDRFEGCSIPNEKFVDFLDVVFHDILFHYPSFTFSQVKDKWGHVRFYTNLPMQKELEIQTKLDEFYQTLK